jgi:hypothetical protein
MNPIKLGPMQTIENTILEDDFSSSLPLSSMGQFGAEETSI